MTAKGLEEDYKLRKKIKKTKKYVLLYLDREIEMLQDLKIYVQCLRSRKKSLLFIELVDQKHTGSKRASSKALEIIITQQHLMYDFETIVQIH